MSEKPTKAATAESRKQEHELMQRIAAGDEKAFDEFYQRYYHLIFSVVSKVLLSREDCQEVCNDILNTVWKKASIYHPSRGTLVTWVCTTARNRSIDRIRSCQRRSALRERYQEALETSVPNSVEEPSRQLDRDDIKKFVHSAIVTLSPDQREVIELSYYKGLTQKEIAAKIDCPLGTVKARMRRGKQNLKNIVNKDLKDEGELLLSSIG